MSPSAKLNCFLRQLELNENVKRNSVHISLNFHSSETDLGAEKLMEIASDYMGKIGFGEQPFLAYQHFDAGHPHIHIVSIKVRSDGSRIDMNNIGRNESEQARKSIEKGVRAGQCGSAKKGRRVPDQADIRCQSALWQITDEDGNTERAGHGGGTVPLCQPAGTECSPPTI
nr:relaxase/mobilization nuclease domain-containing protein [Sphingobacterium multivorum]